MYSWHMAFPDLDPNAIETSVVDRSSVLTEWKEIAKYLGKGVRTVQRWEQLYGLPVRRTHVGLKKAGVLAIPAELDAWLQSRVVAGRAIPDSEQVRALLLRIERLQKENSDLRHKLEAERKQKARGLTVVTPRRKRSALIILFP